MKPKVILIIVALAAWICLWAGFDSSFAEEQSPANAAATDQKDESKASWQLLDDSDFTATVEPWPAKQGPATLKAQATTDDNDQKFAGTVEYRLAAAEKSSEPWKPIPKVSEEKDGTVHFAASITLPKGAVYIQFRVRDRDEKEFTNLTDWKITVK